MRKCFLIVEKERAVLRGSIGLCLLVLVLANTNAALGAMIENITATASSQDEHGNAGPERTVDGSGLTDGLHGTKDSDMWLGSSGEVNPWIQFEFDQKYTLYTMLVWNYNSIVEVFTGWGAKYVKLEYTATVDEETEEPRDWILLGDDILFNRAPSKPAYAANTTVDFAGVEAQYVRITINETWGVAVASGLSEVQFFDAPVVVANEPPVANAGADQEVISSNGINTSVTLDGSQSYDLDEGDTLTYSWREGVEVATVVNPTITLPVGLHTIQLIVNDGTVGSGPDTVEINVITAGQAAENLTKKIDTLVEDNDLPAGTATSLVTSLEAAAQSFDKGNIGAGVNKLQAFQNKVKAQSGKKIDAETAAEIISLAQEIIDAAAG